MIAELFRGPMDGEVVEVQDDQQIMICHQAPMSAAQFIAAADRPDLLEFAAMESVEHAYVMDRKQLSKAGNRRFVYAGVRATK
jgi:hypothetical protein